MKLRFVKKNETALSMPTDYYFIDHDRLNSYFVELVPQKEAYKVIKKERNVEATIGLNPASKLSEKSEYIRPTDQEKIKIMVPHLRKQPFFHIGLPKKAQELLLGPIVFESELVATKIHIPDSFFKKSGAVPITFWICRRHKTDQPTNPIILVQDYNIKRKDDYTNPTGGTAFDEFISEIRDMMPDFISKQSKPIILDFTIPSSRLSELTAQCGSRLAFFKSLHREIKPLLKEAIKNQLNMDIVDFSEEWDDSGKLNYHKESFYISIQWNKPLKVDNDNTYILQMQISPKFPQSVTNMTADLFSFCSPSLFQAIGAIVSAPRIIDCLYRIRDVKMDDYYFFGMIGWYHSRSLDIAVNRTASKPLVAYPILISSSNSFTNSLFLKSE